MVKLSGIVSLVRTSRTRPRERRTDEIRHCLTINGDLCSLFSGLNDLEQFEREIAESAGTG